MYLHDQYYGLEVLDGRDRERNNINIFNTQVNGCTILRNIALTPQYPYKR